MYYSHIVLPTMTNEELILPNTNYGESMEEVGLAWGGLKHTRLGKRVRAGIGWKACSDQV